MYVKNDGKDNDTLFEVLSELRNEKLRINNILIEKYKKLNEFLDFEQNYFSKLAKDMKKLDMILLG